MSIWLIPDPKPKWTAASGATVPSDFVYLLYPASTDVKVFDRPDGAESGVLERAVAMSHDEFGTPYLGVHGPFVRQSDLRFEPPGGSSIDYVRAYESVYQADHSQSPFARVHLRRRKGWDGVVTVVLTLDPDDDHYEEFTYTIANNVATPLTMRRVSGPGWVLGNIQYFLLGLVVATGGACWGVIAARRWVARRQRSIASNSGPPT